MDENIRSILDSQDWDEFKIRLLNEIKAIMSSAITPDGKSWLKDDDVKKLMHISESKLQNLRIQGLLPSSKIGGVHYYRQADIEKMFTSRIR